MNTASFQLCVKDLSNPELPLIPLGEWYEKRVGYADSSVKFYLENDTLMEKSMYSNVPAEKADISRFSLVPVKDGH